jgi:hypothetical protein
MHANQNKIDVSPCKELTDRTEFGECKQVEALFMPAMEAQPPVSLWRLVRQFPS